MKKTIAAAVFAVLINPSLYGMKRSIAAQSCQPYKKYKVESEGVQVEQMSRPCMRSFAFDSFMIVHKMNQRMSEQEVHDLRKNFVIHNIVDRDNPNAVLLKSYHDIMVFNSRVPLKIVRENGQIAFL